MKQISVSVSTASSSLQNASQASNPPHSAPGIPQPATNASISPINTSQPRSWACHTYDDCRVYARCHCSKILWQRKTFPLSSPCRPHRGSRLAHTSTADVHERCLRDGWTQLRAEGPTRQQHVCKIQILARQWYSQGQKVFTFPGYRRAPTSRAVF